MRTEKDFSPADPGELEPYGFDFITHIGPSETIVSADWEIEALDDMLLDGYTLDPDANSRLVGFPSVDIPPGGSRVTRAVHQLSGLQPGNTYRLLARATTDAGNNPSLWAHVTCEPLT